MGGLDSVSDFCPNGWVSLGSRCLLNSFPNTSHACICLPTTVNSSGKLAGSRVGATSVAAAVAGDLGATGLDVPTGLDIPIGLGPAAWALGLPGGWWAVLVL